MGLAIVRDIVRAHSGYIDVESELGVGTEFSIRLPLPKGDRL
jgi:signal transduction histidine kinase